MKVLINNYSSDHSTEAKYINTTLNLIGCSSTLWENNVSAFDIFDIIKPDLYITHINTLYNDTLTYLSQNKNIDFVLNISTIKSSDLHRLEDALENLEIKPKFFFVNNPNHNLTSKHNIVVIQPGADIYFINNSDIEYNIENGIFINEKSQIKPCGNTYHYLSENKNLTDCADIVLPITHFNAIYKNYKTLIFKYFSGYFTQLFFDAAYYNKSIKFDIENKNDLCSYLSKILDITQEECLESINNNLNIQEKISKKHTCLHRVKSLISQFSAKEYIDNITKIIEEKIK